VTVNNGYALFRWHYEVHCRPPPPPLMKFQIHGSADSHLRTLCTGLTLTRLFTRLKLHHWRREKRSLRLFNSIHLRRIVQRTYKTSLSLRLSNGFVTSSTLSSVIDVALRYSSLPNNDYLLPPGNGIATTSAALQPCSSSGFQQLRTPTTTHSTVQDRIAKPLPLQLRDKYYTCIRGI